MKREKVLISLILVFVMVLSFFPLADWAGNPATYEKTIASVDGSITTVLRLTAATTAASAGISMLPGDTATPLAEKLADFAEYFLLILCVLYAEKYLLTLIGILVFKALIPAVCLLLIAAMFWKPQVLRKLAFKAALLALAASCIVPVSTMASDKIAATYQHSMDTTIADTEVFADETSQLTQAGTDQSLLDTILNKMSETVSSLLNRASILCNKLIEMLAEMAVTSCVIPVLVLLLFIWIIKQVTGIDIPIPTQKKKPAAPEPADE